MLISFHRPATFSYQNSFELLALFIIMISWFCSKADAVIRLCSAKIVLLQSTFCALDKAFRNTCERFHFSSSFVSSCLGKWWRLYCHYNYKDNGSTRAMSENFREMKTAGSNIFMSIFIANVITDSWGMFLFSLIDKIDGF